MSIFLVAPINACSFFKIFSTKRFQTWYILGPYATGLHILKMRHLDFFLFPWYFSCSAMAVSATENMQIYR